MTAEALLHDAAEVVDAFAAFGILAFTTGRAMGTFGTHADDPVRAVMQRWEAVQALARGRGATRFATAPQVHGADVHLHSPGWEGWLRARPADGHASVHPGTAMAVTVADCVPVFLAHPSGASAVLHSGWRGTAARIVERGIGLLGAGGLAVSELHVHLGPAICGRCYEVSADVHAQLTGRDPGRPETVDLRSLIATDARAAGIRHITVSPLCTVCHNDRLFSHRKGDAGRQVAVIVR